MPIPTYDQLMLPVLQLTADKTWAMRDLVGKVADELNLTEEERERKLPGGGALLIASRVGWAKTYLKQARLVEQPKRGVVTISQRGRELLATNPTKIDAQFLKQYPEFQAFVDKTLLNKAKASDASSDGQDDATTLAISETPEEQIEAASRALTASLRDALLTRVLEASPASFERLIIDLLLKMGYGGSRGDAGEQLGRSGDGGIDGVIREDRLGLDRIYLQAKRYKPGNSVGSETVQAFIGALVGKGAQKGVLITTSTFTKSALNVARVPGGLRVVLIGGDELMDMMIQFGVGVRIAHSVDIKRVDQDYFEEIETE